MLLPHQFNLVSDVVIYKPTLAKCTFFAATHDIQRVGVDTSSENGLVTTVEFINNTTAKGCFIVLQSYVESEDDFRALLRSESTTLIKRTIKNLQHSAYKVFYHDLEEDLLPNANSVFMLNTTITLTNHEVTGQ